MQTPLVNNHSQNFTGFYKVRHTNGTFVNLLKNEVLPLYEVTTRKPTYFFQGNGPFDSALEKVIREQVEKEGYSYRWFIQNAKNHGIQVPNFDDVDTWVVTGADDIRSLAPLFKRDKFPLLNMLVLIGKKFVEVFSNDNKIPEHIRKYVSIIKRNDNFVQDFKNIIADKKVVEVDNLDNLIKKMVLEK